MTPEIRPLCFCFGQIFQSLRENWIGLVKVILVKPEGNLVQPKRTCTVCQHFEFLKGRMRFFDPNTLYIRGLLQVQIFLHANRKLHSFFLLQHQDCAVGCVIQDFFGRILVLAVKIRFPNFVVMLTVIGLSGFWKLGKTHVEQNQNVA
eukprot:TRINITY_DN10990_c1_g2_i1.p3 TRINITY_DN10990_c1_g2~~TRINITY_DN10990_c1_g2_i1.p3  ORF type:complete len:148 (-),score=2.61 TRINITY_DN10990_c1_g2_i1:120-563(-)